jgi:small subunit ribosomal protein S18
MEKDTKRDSNKESNRKSVRSKYRTEYSGDHVFDYKDPSSLTRFITDGAKITPARISKLSVAQQKKVSGAIKKARTLSLLPDGVDAHDNFGKAELVSPAPFEY